MSQKFQNAEDPSRWIVGIVLGVLVFVAALVVVIVVKRVGSFDERGGQDARLVSAPPPAPPRPVPAAAPTPTASPRNAAAAKETNTADGPRSRESKGVRSLTGLDVIAVD